MDVKGDLMDWLRRSEGGDWFDTSGPLRVVPRRDEFFVIGEGRIIPVTGIFEGNQTIRDIQNEQEDRKIEGPLSPRVLPERSKV